MQKIALVFNPLIVHISDAAAAEQYVSMNETAKNTCRCLLAGGHLRWYYHLKKTAPYPTLLRRGLNTAAVRVPKNNIAHQLLEKFSGAIAAPSANKSGQISPTTAAHVDGEFGDELDMIIDGGPCDKGIESTIVSIENDQIIMLRPRQYYH